VADRKALQDALTDSGVGTGVHYPIPLHLQKAYAHLGYNEGSFPVTERVASEIVSLPMFPQLNRGQQDLVVGEVKKFLTAKMASIG
jgi:dTDP-4-amino-4,6-dideoxygalactose transaminase